MKAPQASSVPLIRVTAIEESVFSPVKTPGTPG